MLIQLKNVKMYFTREKFGRKVTIRAVDGVDLEINKGEVVGLVGESGSGKSTLGRVSLRLYKPTSGRVIFEGVDITKMPERKLRKIRRKMQLIAQDPYASFDPLQTIGESLIEPLIEHGMSKEEAIAKALKMLERVGLKPAEEFFERLPSQLSGGQLQRVAIVRAMLLEPDYVVADEPTSSLDVSVRVSVLELLKEFKERGVGMLFITHDLAVAKLISDRIAVMYLGKIVEEGRAEEVLKNPLHPYTKALISALPTLGSKRIRFELKGETGDPANPPKGCRLRPRCPLAKEKCKEEPPLREVDGRKVRCWFV